jgi:hypothetical protein
VCSAFAGGLTTDCPGTEVDFDRQREIYETLLDYTDDRGWHQGAPMEQRVPHFAATRLPPRPPRIDPRLIVAPSVDWTRVDRTAALQHELALRGIAWVLADRACDDLSAALTRAQDMVDACGGDSATDTPDMVPDDPRSSALTRLEGVRDNFQRACRRVEERDDEFRQAARKLVDALEAVPLDPHKTTEP